MQQLEEVWKQLEGAVTNGQNVSALSLCMYLLLSATLALYIRLLYKKCSASSSDKESISRVFPLLALVTTGVIAVVKSSLALSLGLVGALSIVRFRAAIKDPEELVYLFLCIGIGLASGAEQPLLAIALVVVATIFIVVIHLTSRSQRQHRLLLTITGDAESYFTEGKTSVMSTVEMIAGEYTLQRYDVENGRGQLRIVLGDSNPRKTAQLIEQLRERLPDCDLSYVNLNSTL
jgi:uncharacterized membrane protein YhiD involved in acid resistance